MTTTRDKQLRTLLDERQKKRFDNKASKGEPQPLALWWAGNICLPGTLVKLNPKLLK